SMATSAGLRLCICVDDDVDIYSMDDIIWALTTRVNPNQDLLKPVPGGAGQTFIPSERVTAGDRQWTGMNIRFEGGIGIDATIPYGLANDFMRPVYPIDRVDPSGWFDKDQIAKGKELMKTQSWAEVLAKSGR
ncbi:MAG: UbiD family decarboxylase, partial [Chloroflexi bacterium]|nr:UbiD family decarboxylase [Chloroflexota bacterium]